MIKLEYNEEILTRSYNLSINNFSRFVRNMDGYGKPKLEIDEVYKIFYNTKLFQKDALDVAFGSGQVEEFFNLIKTEEQTEIIKTSLLDWVSDDLFAWMKDILLVNASFNMYPPIKYWAFLEYDKVGCKNGMLTITSKLKVGELQDALIDVDDEYGDNEEDDDLGMHEYIIKYYKEHVSSSINSIEDVHENIDEDFLFDISEDWEVSCC